MAVLFRFNGSKILMEIQTGFAARSIYIECKVAEAIPFQFTQSNLCYNINIDVCIHPFNDSLCNYRNQPSAVRLNSPCSNIFLINLSFLCCCIQSNAESTNTRPSENKKHQINCWDVTIQVQLNWFNSNPHHKRQPKQRAVQPNKFLIKFNCITVAAITFHLF